MTGCALLDNLMPARKNGKRLPCERLQEQNDKLTALVGHLMYVKPPEVTAILVNGQLLRFDELLADVGLRWESGNEVEA